MLFLYSVPKPLRKISHRLVGHYGKMQEAIPVGHFKRTVFVFLGIGLGAVLSLDNRDFAFFVFERTKHQPRRNLRSYLVLQRLCNEAALGPGIDAFWY